MVRKLLDLSSSLETIDKKILIFMENQDFLAKIFGKLKYSAEEEIYCALIRCIMHQFIAIVNIYLSKFIKKFIPFKYVAVF